jgi:hypothetical protein
MSFQTEERRRNRQRRKQIINPDSIKYVIVIVVLWFVAILSVIIGFILHFAINVGINGSGVLWAFGFAMSIVASIYTYLYKKSQSLKTIEEKAEILKYFPGV